MATGVDRFEIEFLPLKVAFSGFFVFHARCGKFTEPCLLGLIGLHTGTNINSIVLVLLENVNMLVFLTQNLD